MKEHGGQAFPSRDFMSMTLRDWLAGQALIAIINQSINNGMHANVEYAYEYADAMIAERRKE